MDNTTNALNWFEIPAEKNWTAPGGTKVAWFKDPNGNLLSLND